MNRNSNPRPGIGNFKLPVFWPGMVVQARESCQFAFSLMNGEGFQDAHNAAVRLGSGLYFCCSPNIRNDAADCRIVEVQKTRHLHLAIPVVCNSLRNERVPRCFAAAPLRKQFLQARPPDKSLPLRYLFYLLLPFGHQRPQSLGKAFHSQKTLGLKGMISLLVGLLRK